MSWTTLLHASILLLCIFEFQAAAGVTNMNSSSSPPPPPPPPLTTVSWQTAFWILVALALNAMTQNSTLDRHFPTGVFFPMRSSPFVCAGDTLEILLQLLAHMYTGASAVDATKLVVRDRMWRPPRHHGLPLDGNGEAREPPFPFGTQHPRIHAVLFVLGVLPQAIKLFGMRGIPWTQACGAMYLSSFLVIEAVGALAWCAEDGAQAPREEAEAETALGRMRGMWLGVAIGHVGVWGWCVWRPVCLFLVDENISNVRKWLQGCGYSILFCGILSAASIPFLLSASYDNRRIFEWPVVIAAFFLTCFFSLEDLKGPSLRWVFLQLPVMWSGAVIGMHYVMVTLRNLGGTFMITQFGVANLVIFILYYCFQYNPTGTVKPSWVEVMG